MVLSVTLNPCIDHAIFIDSLKMHSTNRVQRVERDAGGKGLNVSRIYASLGGETVATGFLGGRNAEFIRSMMAAEGIVDEFISIEGETRTNISFEDQQGLPPTTFNEKGPLLAAKEWEILTQKLQTESSRASWVVLGGSVPPGAPEQPYPHLMHEIARSAPNCKIILDADGEVLKQGLAARPFIVKPNVDEASALLGRSLESDADFQIALRQVHEMMGGGNRIAIISRGKDGAVAFDGSTMIFGTSPKIRPISTIGSGDSFIGGLAWALDHGLPLLEAVRWGLAAGAATALTDGTGIGKADVIRELHPQASTEVVFSS